MVDRRQKNADWRVYDAKGVTYMGSYEAPKLAVLMDIRDELQTLNRLLGCPNFTAVPTILREISAHSGSTALNTKKKRRKNVAA